MIFDRRSAPLHFAVRIPAIAHYLGQILLASAALMLVPLVVALASGNFNVGARYIIACGLLGGFGRAGDVLLLITPESRLSELHENYEAAESGSVRVTEN